MAERADSTVNATGDPLPIAPSMGVALAAARVPRLTSMVGPRVLYVSGLSVAIAFVASIAARVLMVMIALVTNVAFLGRISSQPSAPADHHLLKRGPTVAFECNSLREAADLMVTEGVGRLPVVTRREPTRVIGLLTRSDLVSAHAGRLNENDRVASSRLPMRLRRPKVPEPPRA